MRITSQLRIAEKGFGEAGLSSFISIVMIALFATVVPSRSVLG